MVISLAAPGAVFTQAQLQGGFTLTRSVTTGRDITLGSCVAGKLEFTVLDLEEGPVKHYAGTEFLVSAYELSPYTFRDSSLLVFQDGDRYYFPGDREVFGLYTAQKPERLDETRWRFTCYDRMTAFDRNADSWLAGLRWPVTLEKLLESLCTFCGVALAKDQELLNGSFPVQENLAGSGITGREVLGWIAEAAGCFCEIDPEGKLRLGFYRPTGTVIRRHISTRVADHRVKEIDKLQIRTTKNDVGVITGTGANAYVIQGNPLLAAAEDAELRPVAEQLFRRVKGITYTPLEVEAYAEDAPCRPGDIVEVETRRGRYTAYVTTTVTNGVKTTVASVGEESREKLQTVNRSIRYLRGRTNEVIRTVEETISRLYDAETGDISQLRQTASSLSTQIKNARGDISTLTQTATGLSARIKSAEGDISTLTQTAAGLSTRVQSAEGSISTLTQTAGELSAQVQNQGGSIASLRLTVSDLESEIALKADKITLKGYVEFKNLTDGTTSISGGNIRTGTVSADRLESKVLTTDNISTKNLTVRGTLLTTGNYGGVRIEDGVAKFTTTGWGNSGKIYYKNSGYVSSGLYIEGDNGICIDASYKLTLMSGSQGIYITPATGGDVFIGSGYYNDRVYIGSGTNTGNQNPLYASGFYAQNKQGYTGTVTYMKTASTSGKLTITGGIITGVS